MSSRLEIHPFVSLCVCVSRERVALTPAESGCISYHLRLIDYFVAIRISLCHWVSLFVSVHILIFCFPSLVCLTKSLGPCADRLESCDRSEGVYVSEPMRSSRPVPLLMVSVSHAIQKCGYLCSLKNGNYKQVYYTYLVEPKVCQAR